MGSHGDKFLSLGWSPSEDSEGVSGVNQVGAHRAAHYSGTDPSQTSIGWVNGCCHSTAEMGDSGGGDGEDCLGRVVTMVGM